MDTSNTEMTTTTSTLASSSPLATSSSTIGNGVHCKVFYNGQFRRFQLTPSYTDTGATPRYEYAALKSRVSAMLSLGTNVLLKYQDNENDYITISSDEELSYAVNILKSGEILRLFTTPLEEPTSSMAYAPPPPSPWQLPPGFPGHPPHPPPGLFPPHLGPSPFPPPPDAYGRCAHRGREHPYGGGGRRGGRHGGSHGHGHGPRPTDEEWGGAISKRERLHTKIAILESLLADLSDDDDRGKEKLEKKIVKLKNKLEMFDRRQSRKDLSSSTKPDAMEPDEGGAAATPQAKAKGGPLWTAIKNKKAAIRQAEMEGNAELVEKLTSELKALRLEKKEKKVKK